LGVRKRARQGNNAAGGPGAQHEQRRVELPRDQVWIDEDARPDDAADDDHRGVKKPERPAKGHWRNLIGTGDWALGTRIRRACASLGISWCSPPGADSLRAGLAPIEARNNSSQPRSGPQAPRQVRRPSRSFFSATA